MKYPTTRSSLGFTFIQVLIAAVNLGIIAAFTYPSSGGYKKKKLTLTAALS